MESIPRNPILEHHPNTLADIRKCWNLEGERMKQSMRILEEWLLKQNHFVKKTFSPEYLERTLITAKGSIEKAKSLIEKLCTSKTLLPKYFLGGGVKEELRHINEITTIAPLPKLTDDHYRPVMLGFSKNLTPAKFMSIYQYATVLCEYLKRHDYCNGFVIIDDLRDADLMNIISNINLIEFQQIVSILMDGFGARIKGIHVITESKVVDLLVSTLKPMLSAKIANRIYVYGNVEDLNSVIDVSLLPKEYGGSAMSIELLKAEWFDVLSSEDHGKYLAEMTASCTDESLRPTASYDEQVIGLPGSFRTLAVD